LALLERRREFAAANLKAESYLEREHNGRWAALGVAHATRGTTANVLTLLLPRRILARDQLNPYLKGAQGKEVEQWQTGTDHLIAQSIARELAFAPPEQRDQLAQWLPSGSPRSIAAL
jgi:hypothetical protein